MDFVILMLTIIVLFLPGGGELYNYVAPCNIFFAVVCWFLIPFMVALSFVFDLGLFAGQWTFKMKIDRAQNNKSTGVAVAQILSRDHTACRRITNLCYWLNYSAGRAINLALPACPAGNRYGMINRLTVKPEAYLHTLKCH